MKNLSIKLSWVTYLFFWVFLLPGTAHAYLDPGTGSFVLQMFAAGFLGAIFYVKTAWTQIKHFFASKFGKKPANVDPMEDGKP